MTIFSLIPKIMNEVGAIAKTRTGSGIQYKFRGIDDLYKALQGHFASHGVFVAPKVLSSVREERQSKTGGTLIYTILTVQFTFYAGDGSSVEAVVVGEAMDSSDKSSNKAMSAAMKYALLQVFCIPTEEDNDTENHNHLPQKSVNSPPFPVFPPKDSVTTLKDTIKPLVVPGGNYVAPTVALGSGPSQQALKRIFALARNAHWESEDLHIYIRSQYGHESLKQLTEGQYQALGDHLEKLAGQ